MQILQRGGEVDTTTHRPPNSSGGAPRGRSAADPHISRGKDMVAISITDGETTAIEGSGVFGAQKGNRQEAAAKGGTNILDLPGNMAFGG